MSGVRRARRTLLAAAAAALALAAAGSGAPAARLGGVGLPAGWTHAEINYSVGGVPHTLVLDRGRVTAVSPASLTLRENDGSSVQVGLSASTQIVVNGVPAGAGAIRRGASVVAWRIDGAAATRVRVVQRVRLRR